MFGYCQVYMITDGGVPVHVIQVSINIIILFNLLIILLV